MILDEAIDALRGDATTGSLSELRTACDSVDYKLVHNQIPQLERPAAHAKLEEIQNWFTDDSTAGMGAKDVVDGFIDALKSWS